MFNDIPNIIGLIGVTLTLIAYGLLQTNVWHSEQIRYSFLNALGSLMILYSLMHHWNLSATVMEVIWAMFSIYGILNAWKKKQRH